MKAETPSSKNSEWAPGFRFSAKELMDPKAEPAWPRGDYASEDYRRDSARHTAFMEQRERVVEEVALARLLARRRLPLSAMIAPKLEAMGSPKWTRSVFPEPLAHDDPRVEAWRKELGKSLEVTTLRVFRPVVQATGEALEDVMEELDYDATTARAEDVLACLRLLRDDVAERGGSLPTDRGGF